ncbi:MAG: serine kinase [Thermodesulfobacteriota bacterium]|nr:serine kinase [Thermodesulfobacteriota bacterium]
MDLTLLAEKLNMEARCGVDSMSNEVSGGYAGDLLSDVMTNSKKGDVWITCQSHQNIVAVSVLKEHAGIILVLGKQPDKDTVEKANRERIPLLITKLSGFETAGKIYNLLHP